MPTEVLRVSLRSLHAFRYDGRKQGSWAGHRRSCIGPIMRPCKIRRASRAANLVAVQAEGARARVPVSRDLDRGELFLARPKTEVLGGIRTAGGHLPQRLQLILGGPDPVEQVEQGPAHRRAED